MPDTHYFPPTGEDGTSPSVYCVVIGGAALLGAGLVPVVFAIIIRHYRQRPPSLESEFLGGTSGVGGTLRQQEPKLFDVYVKPDLDVDEGRFKDILPMTVRVADEEKHTMSTPSTTQWINWSPWGRGREVDKPEAPAKVDLPKSYDVAVLITMPSYHPRVGGHWDELGEYSIGTLRLSAIDPLNDSSHR